MPNTATFIDEDLNVDQLKFEKLRTRLRAVPPPGTTGGSRLVIQESFVDFKSFEAIETLVKVTLPSSLESRSYLTDLRNNCSLPTRAQEIRTSEGNRICIATCPS